MESIKTKILVVDDNHTFRNAICNFLQHSNNYKVVGQAANGNECLEKCYTSEADIILMDINMPELNGIQTTKIINQKTPHYPKIIALTQYDEFEYAKSMIQAGAAGYILKSEVGKYLNEAIEKVLSGKIFIPDITTLK